MNFLETLYPRAQAANRRLVLPEGQDPRVIRAAIEIKKRRLATPLVLARLLCMHLTLAQNHYKFTRETI